MSPHLFSVVCGRFMPPASQALMLLVLASPRQIGIATLVSDGNAGDAVRARASETSCA